MFRNIRATFIVIVLVTAVAAYLAVPFADKPRIPLLDGFRISPAIDLAGGAELRYKVLFEPAFKGDRRLATAKAADVVRRRLDARRLQEYKVNTLGEDEILIQLPGADADRLEECKAVIGPIGKLRLHAAAPADLQERCGRDRIPPKGYAIVEDTDGSPLLIEESPVIEGSHILNAEPHQEFGPAGPRWVTSFELDAEGARLFDEAASKLYRQRPRGRIVIILDDKVHSAPVVKSPAFQGRVQISGGRE
jgi:preprotein translocase subunit SecD